MSGWRPALRIAWRDALRAKGRSLLVLVMITLPVLAVTAAAIVLRTAEATGLERVDRVMGAADARAWTDGRGKVVQAPDPNEEGYGSTGPIDTEDPPTAAEVLGVLGEDARLLPIVETWSQARLGDRAVGIQLRVVDLADPMAAGLFALEEGRVPDGPDEVVVNQALLDKGYALGDRLEGLGAEPVIVGSGRDADMRDTPVAVGPRTALLGEDAGAVAFRRGDWLVDSGPVTWPQVRELNEIGVVVASRAVLEDPPELAGMAEQMGYDTGRDEVFAVVALIVVMALLEVVLLAGPAFAVGARRQSRALALIAATGGTPGQARKVVLAGGLVLGAVASCLGLLLGTLLGWAALPVAQRWSDQWFGPFELPWRYLAAIAAFGLVSAFLAALVPAWIASRQDVVAVLAGRRGDRKPRASTPVLGLVLLGGGIAAASYGAVTSDSGNGAIWIAASAVVSVLGMILVVPLVVSLVARLAGRLPLTPRYAARDAARHRTRTVPAVAAVAATVAGVVALGIANASDEEQNASTYTPQLAMGAGKVSWWPEALPGEEAPDPEPVWDRILDVVDDAAPAVEATRVRGVAQDIGEGGYTHVSLRAPGRGEEPLLWSYGGFPADVLVDATAASSGISDPETRAEVERALEAGRAVVFTSEPVEGDEVVVHTETWQEGADEAVTTPPRTIPATYVEHDGAAAPAQAVLPPAVAEDLGMRTATAGILLEGDLSPATETRITEVVQGVEAEAGVYVERGYERPDDAVIILLVLFVLGGVLMLGGTLTATFLALSDARPDLATLSAVGAAPRTRRAVAASYALVIGFVGALLGAGVGFIPGIAISRPLTSMSYVDPGLARPGPFLDVPWLLIGALVVLLPLLTAAVVGLTARSRLPMVARLE